MVGSVVLVNMYEPLMMQQERLRNARLLLVCVAFTVASYYLWIYGYINVLVCMVGILFFGIIGIPAMTMAIIKPGYLRVDENGFEFDNVNARKVKISWDQIESIRLGNVGLYKYVHVRCLPGSRRNALIISRMSGYPAKRIAEILVDYGEHFRQNQIDQGY